MKTEQGAGGSMDEARTCTDSDAGMTQESRSGSLDVLDSARPRARHAPDGSTYFVRAGDTIKIGFAENFKRRLGGLQTGHAETLAVLAVVPAALIDEYQTHQLFAHLRIRGEWFRADPELLYFIEQAKIEAGQLSAIIPPVPAVVSEEDELERSRQQLYRIRPAYRDNEPASHRINNLIEMIANYLKAESPEQAQNLKRNMAKQMKDLSELTAL